MAVIVGDDGKALWRIHGVDYDLHSFVESHPGGALAIRLGEGTECTQLFESYHVSSSPAFRVLEKHRVTDPRSTMEPMPTISAFKADLDLMVRAHFASGSGRPRSHRATWSHWLLCAFFFGAELVCWYNWMLNGSWLAAFLLPVFFWLMAVNVSHDASHFAFARRPWVNELCAFSAMPLLYEPITWYHQHVISHHTHCNEVAADVDLQHFKPLQLHAHDTKAHPHGKPGPLDWLKVMLVGVQLAVWVPLNVWGCLPESIAADYHATFQPAIQVPYGLTQHRHYRYKSLASPALNIFIILFMICAHGFRGLALLVPPYAIVSMTFLLVTQISHIQPEVQTAELQNEQNEEPDFFKRQASTSVDYGTGSWLLSLATGGLNTQALHHCIPHISACHYTELYPKFAGVCAKHGVVLNTRRSLFHAAETCGRHIWKMNPSARPSVLEHLG